MKFLPGKRTVMVFLAVAAVMMLPLAANANVLYFGSLDSSSGGGVAATENWDNGGFKIAWSINDDEGFIGGLKVFDYTYTITITDGLLPNPPIQLKEISHFILEVSTGAVAADFFDLNTAFSPGDPQVYSPSDPGNSNPGMPASIFGLKFATIPVVSSETKLVYTINFDSFRSPVLGSFYAKDGTTSGNDLTAWNTGLADAVNGQFIYVPDTQVFIPIPPSVYLMGSGLLGLGLIGWRRRKQKA